MEKEEYCKKSKINKHGVEVAENTMRFGGYDSWMYFFPLKDQVIHMKKKFSMFVVNQICSSN